MSLILSLDTSLETAFVSVARNGSILAQAANTNQKDHGSFMQPAIQTVLKNAGLSLSQVEAVAVASGPGSYTGLRVGMATAKGICFSLEKPLILISNLEILSFAAVSSLTGMAHQFEGLFCPMIDARRMEVFTALYDKNLTLLNEPAALILDDSAYVNSLLKSKVAFFGNGAKKWKAICNHENAIFPEVLNNPLAMSKLALIKFSNNEFADLAYAEPFYGKAFYDGTSAA